MSVANNKRPHSAVDQQLPQDLDQAQTQQAMLDQLVHAHHHQQQASHAAPPAPPSAAVSDSEDETPAVKKAKVASKKVVASKDARAEYLHQMGTFWEDQLESSAAAAQAKPVLPLARIKKIIKNDDDVRSTVMISGEAPFLLSRACELFTLDLTMRAWAHTDATNRRTLQRSDVADAVASTEQFDFLLDIVPRDESQQAAAPISTSSVLTSFQQKAPLPAHMQQAQAQAQAQAAQSAYASPAGFAGTPGYYTHASPAQAVPLTPITPLTPHQQQQVYANFLQHQQQQQQLQYASPAVASPAPYPSPAH